MKEIINKLNSHNSEIDKKIEREENLISMYESLLKSHQEKVKKLENKKVNFVGGFVKPLAEAIAKRFNLYYDICGPFGFEAQTTIYWSSNKQDFYFDDRNLKLRLYPRDYKNGIIDYEIDGEKALLPLDLDEINKLLQGDRTLLEDEHEMISTQTIQKGFCVS